MIVLGIETSCDETAAAVVDDDRTIWSNVVYSQLDEHIAFGGVVPEIAARAHLDALDGVVRGAMSDAGVYLSDIDGIAATGGPGLIGGVIVGTMTAKAMAMADAMAISCASSPVSAAVDPSRKLFSPACPALSSVWIWLNRTMPRPKKTLKTVPIAVSSGRRV